MVGSRGHRASRRTRRARWRSSWRCRPLSPGRRVAGASGRSAARVPLPLAEPPRVPGLEGAARRQGGTRARRVGLPGPHAVTRRPLGVLGRLGRLGGRRTPAGARGIRSWLVGPGRRPAHPTRRSPVLTVPAAGCTRARGRPEPFSRNLGPGRPGPVGPWRRCRSRRPGSPCRRCRLRPPGRPRRRCRLRCPVRLWGAGVAGNVEQVARRVHRRRVQYLVPARTWPGIAGRPTRAAFGRAAPGLIAVLIAVPLAGCRGAMPVARRMPVVRPGPPGPAPARPPGPRERGYQQGRQADRDACRGQGQAEDGDMAGRTRADHVRRRAHHDENQAQQDRSGAHDRQADEPRPPGGGIRAHWSTIASPFAPRKPYRQARALR